MKMPTVVLTAALLALAMTGFARATELPPITPVAHVDLPRFMGNWYVIATIPTRFEKGAHNAVESYALQPDGRVDTHFRFRPGSFTTPVKTIRSTGFVKAGTGNAVWGVQVIWPIKAQYIVAYLKDDYSQTIVARDARDYTWIMARTPTVSDADYAALVARVKQLGYSLDGLRKVPQAWPKGISQEHPGANRSADAKATGSASP
jgi:apolipoprotein D and lipocalin family protein